MLGQLENIQATNPEGSTALMEASAGGLLPVVKELWRKANTETQDNDGFTARCLRQPLVIWKWCGLL